MRHLRYFVAVAEEQSFSRAADRLWVAQPSLSTQIQRLETELGSRLFERHARGVDLTDAGREVLEWARNVLRAADYAMAMGRQQADGLVGSIRLGAAPDLRCASLRHLLQMYGRERPLVDVSVLTASAETLWNRLGEERLDAMIAPSVFAHEDVSSMSLASEPWVAVMAANHRLSGSPTIGLAELARERILVRGDVHNAAVVDLLGDCAPAKIWRTTGGLEAIAAVDDARSLTLTTGPTRLLPGTVVRRLRPVRRLAFSLYWRESGATPALSGLLDVARQGQSQMRWARPDDLDRDSSGIAANAV